MIIIGNHYQEYSDIKFKLIDFKFKSFDNWLGVYGFKPIEIEEHKAIGILNERFEKEFLERGRRIFYYTFQDFKSYTSG